MNSAAPFESNGPCRYCFNGFILDTGSRQLSRNGERVALAPKEYHALLLLVEAGSQAVDRTTMIQTMWPDTVVGDTSLGRCISALRRHLGVDAIRPVTKFGYRFALPVTVERASERAVERVAEPAAVVPAILAKAEANPLTESGHVAVAAALPVESVSLIQPRRLPVSSSSRWWLLGTIAAAAGLLAVAAWTHTGGGAARGAKAEQAAYWDTVGLTALHEGTCFRARKAFEQGLRVDAKSPRLHMHLAQTWLELESPAEAAREVCLADASRSGAGLATAETHAFQATRNTVQRDFAGAVEEYREALAKAAPEDHVAAMQDLGRALERAGQIDQAKQMYVAAAAEQPTNAGIQLRLALVEALQRDQPAANRYLDEAANLYEATSNVEGSGEVGQQRGSMAYVRADYEEAEKQYRVALDVGQRLGDIPLETRALGALSTVNRWRGQMPEAEEFARRELDLSTTAGWEFGKANSVMHLANLAVARHDRVAAKELLQRASDLARALGSPRLQANAEFSMADLAGAEGDYVAEQTHAQSAMSLYQMYGSIDGVEDARLLAVSAELGKGDLAAALADAQKLLSLAHRTQSDLFVEDTEEELGDIYSALGDAPTALTHYQAALAMSRKTDSQPWLKSMGVAEGLARVGRVDEAEAIMRKLPDSARKDPDNARRYAMARAVIAFARKDDETVLRVVREVSLTMTPAAAADFTALAAESEARMGRKVAASRDTKSLIDVARLQQNPVLRANAERLLQLASR